MDWWLGFMGNKIKILNEIMVGRIISIQGGGSGLDIQVGSSDSPYYCEEKYK